MSDVNLPTGCKLLPLMPHFDERGSLTEIYRQDWVEGDQRVQWNVVHSEAGTLRGVHTHTNRVDFLVVVQGEMWLGLYDLRRNSDTFQQSSLIKITPETRAAAYVPTGVAHGFYFTQPSTTLYGLSAYFSMDDELGCDPADSDLKIPWPKGIRLLSERDQNAGTLEEMQIAYDQKTGVL